MADKDYLDMSDDDFIKLSAPNPSDNQKTEKPQEETPEAKASETEELETEVETEAEGIKPDTEKENEPAEGSKEGTEADTEEEGKDGDKSPADIAKPDASKPEDGTKDKINPLGSKETPSKTDKSKTEPKDETTTVVETDYKGFYEQIMKPFKANGRDFTLKSPEEAIRMMQMGAGYGRKLQDLQPHLKTLKMLENNGLLDENKLGFLIDIHQKNPDAIKKLIKESGIDPLDINTNEEVAYVPGNHKVSDSQMKFADAVAGVRTRPNGAQLVNEVYSSWDQKSKDALWGNPEVLGIIQEQRESGVYDLILAEVERQKLLGLIPLDTPFLGAYKAAGDALMEQHRTAEPAKQPTQPKVLDTRAATPKPKVINDDKAKAASPTQSGGKKAKTVINPLAMSDEDFLKQFGDRL